MSEAVAAGAAAPAKKGKAKLLIIIGLLVVLLAGGGAAAFVMLKKDPVDEEAADDEGVEQGEKDKKAKKKKKANVAPVFVALDPFTVNLADTDVDRVAQIGVVIEVSDKKFDEAIKAQMPAVRNAILLLLSSKTGRELLTLEGKEQLARQIGASAAQRLDKGAVETVHFSQFIVQ